MNRSPLSLQVVTFNIRYDCGLDGNNNFCFRKPLIEETIQRERPEIIGFQEALPHMMDWLRETLTEYHVVGCGRSADYGDEHMAVAYRKDCLELLGLSTFWLSSTPEAPGSRYEDQSDNPRICTCATLKHREHTKPFRVYVTHLDDRTASARLKGISLVLSHMDWDRVSQCMPAILMGDFNAHPSDPELAPLFQHPGLRDITGDIPYTFHEFGNEAAFEKLDYLFLTKEWSATQVTLWTDCRNGVYLSDHYPVSARLEWED